MGCLPVVESATSEAVTVTLVTVLSGNVGGVLMVITRLTVVLAV